MKILVDELPYYGDPCPFAYDYSEICYLSRMSPECPRNWNKYKVTSNDNPHECELLKEVVNEN